MIPLLEQLEGKLHTLVGQTARLRKDNDRLHEELALSREEHAQQIRQLETERKKLRSELAEKIQQHPIAIPKPDIAAQGDTAEKLQEKNRQIQILEKERANLRDQIALLQTSLQNKEKDWNTKFETAQSEWLKKERELDDKYHQADNELTRKEYDWQQNNQSLNTRLEAAESRVEHLQTELDAKNKLAGELQTALSAEQSSLKVLRSETAAEIEKLNDRLRSEKFPLQQQILKLNQRNQEYRSLLFQNAEDIRALLSRMPAPKQDSGNADHPEYPE